MRVCREYCQRHNITITDTYIDRATSASHGIQKRTSFLQMIADASEGNWEAVIVYKLDRFARNRYDSATYKAKLKRYGIRLISATENLSDSPESIILESVLEGMAEFYSAELSQKIRRGQRESAAKHKPIGGQVPLGYRFVDGKYVVDEKTAPVVREIFQRYANGEQLSNIGKSLNARGYRTAKGAEFTKNSFHRMLSNKRYIGYYIFKDMEEPGVLPQLIDDETWNAVQKRVKLNQQYPGSRKAKDPYLLLGKLICGHCETKMIGTSGTGKNGSSYHYYVCKHQRYEHTCDKTPIPKDLIENAVVDDIKEMMTDEFIEQLAEAAVAENNRIIEEDQTMKMLTAKLEDAEKRLANLSRAFEFGDVPETILKRLKEVEAERRQILVEISTAEKMVIRLDRDQVVFWLEKFVSGDYDNEAFRRKLIDRFVNSVTVWDDDDGGYKLTLIYNITDSPRTVTLSDLKKEGSQCASYAPLWTLKANTFLFVQIRPLKREAY